MSSDMDPHDAVMPTLDGGDGFAVDDLPAMRQELFRNCLEGARADHDPAVDWEGFAASLWGALSRAFGWRPQAWPPDVAVPLDTPLHADARQARADRVAAAVRERFGIELDVDYTPRSSPGGGEASGR